MKMHSALQRNKKKQQLEPTNYNTKMKCIVIKSVAVPFDNNNNNKTPNEFSALQKTEANEQNEIKKKSINCVRRPA